MRVMRPFTNHVINPITRLFAGWLPGFAILTYVGRTSGRRYSTPINVFRRDGAYIFALTYGSDVQWLKKHHRRWRLRDADAGTNHSSHGPQAVRGPEPEAHAPSRPRDPASEPGDTVCPNAPELTPERSFQAAGCGRARGHSAGHREAPPR